MHIRKVLILALCAMLLISGASAETFTDAMGREVALDAAPEHTVALLGSYGEVWIAAGGYLAGTTQDALESPGAVAQGGVTNLGSHSEPNMELLMELEPDFVILSADAAAHPAIAGILEDAGIPCAFFSIYDWRAYMDTLSLFTRITGREDLYQAQLESVQAPIEALIESAQAQPGYGQKTALLLRAYSTSVKAKGSDGTVSGPILADMGLINIADDDSALSENLTLEAILEADPDYIFVVAMGTDLEAAQKTLEDTLLSNPAWSTLTAVREGRFVTLDRELFHLRPNARWAESYQIIYDLLYLEE